MDVNRLLIDNRNSGLQS